MSRRGVRWLVVLYALIAIRFGLFQSSTKVDSLCLGANSDQTCSLVETMGSTAAIASILFVISAVVPMIVWAVLSIHANLGTMDASKAGVPCAASAMSK
jgi:hypothetical protein